MNPRVKVGVECVSLGLIKDAWRESLDVKKYDVDAK